MIKENVEPSKRVAWEGGDGGGRWPQGRRGSGGFGVSRVATPAQSKKLPELKLLPHLSTTQAREAHLR